MVDKVLLKGEKAPLGPDFVKIPQHVRRDFPLTVISDRGL